MNIGNVIINGYAALAPMAGVADRAFRELCKDFGASYVVSEMVSAKGGVFSQRKIYRAHASYSQRTPGRCAAFWQ